VSKTTWSPWCAGRPIHSTGAACLSAHGSTAGFIPIFNVGASLLIKRGNWPAMWAKHPTYANRTYWGTMRNLLTFGGNRLNSGSLELYAQHELACSVLRRRNADQWSAGASPVPGIVRQHGQRQDIGVPGRRHPHL
jgi:hypothetical protein